jgi:hypothetical protein
MRMQTQSKEMWYVGPQGGEVPALSGRVSRLQQGDINRLIRGSRSTKSGVNEKWRGMAVADNHKP